MAILVVEDDPTFRELLLEFLRCVVPGTDVFFAVSGQAAIDMLPTARAIELVICDYLMQPGNGVDVYRFMRQKMPSTPFVLFTSWPLAAPEDFAGDSFLGVIAKEDLAGLRTVVTNALLKQQASAR